MRTIGALVFDGFELLDLYGPLEMFALLEDDFRMEIVGESREVASGAGPRALADKLIATAGPYDILLIPGGLGVRRELSNTRLIDWIGAEAERARTVATVCTGAALLARTGHLDGRRATSNKAAFDWVKAQGPRVNWVAKARWVADGKYFTASGVSAGIDMSLALIETMLGPAKARDAANWAEYNRQNDPGTDPFADLYGLSDT